MLNTLGGPRLGAVFKLVLGGLHVNYEVNHGIFVANSRIFSGIEDDYGKSSIWKIS